jgi:hypothetical protein
MAVNDYFDELWDDQAREWANLQFGHLSELGRNGEDTLEALMTRLTATLRGGYSDRLKHAFALDLPWPDVQDDIVWSYMAAIQRAEWIVLFRFHKGDDIAYFPRAATNNIEYPIHLKNGSLCSAKDLPALVKQHRDRAEGYYPVDQNGKEISLGEHMRRYRREGVYMPGEYPDLVGKDKDAFEMYQRLLIHQTGEQKDDDPYLSTSCVLPCVCGSECYVVSSIRDEAEWLDLFLVPGSKIRVLWPKCEITNTQQGQAGSGQSRSLFSQDVKDLSGAILKQTSDLPELKQTLDDVDRRKALAKQVQENDRSYLQINSSWWGMIVEREVAYCYPPCLKTWRIAQVANPLKKPGKIPSTTTISLQSRSKSKGETVSSSSGALPQDLSLIEDLQSHGTPVSSSSGELPQGLAVIQEQRPQGTKSKTLPTSKSKKSQFTDKSKKRT